MAGSSKRGGFRGGGGFKKGYAKKRAPDDDDDAPRATKKSKGDDDEEEEGEGTEPLVPRLQNDEDNNPFVAINHSGKRRVTVSDFKGTTLISIREYWKNDEGDLKPGKKGISLSVDQYNALIAATPLLESVLSKRDIQTIRPDYEAELNAAVPAEKNKGAREQSTANVDDEDDED